MSSCPATPTPSTASAEPSALDQLIAFVRELGDNPQHHDDFGALERELRERTMAVEAEVIQRELEKFDIDVPVIEVDGVEHKRVMRSAATVHAACDDVRVTRTLYRSDPGERCIDPVALRAGLVEGRWTPCAARQATWAVAHMTPKAAAEFFEMLGCMVPCSSTLDRLPKQVSARWEQQRQDFEEQLRRGSVIPEEAVTVASSLDGVMAPMKDGNRADKRARAVAKGKKPCGPAGFREASCATVSFYDADGERIKTWRQGRMPQKKKADLKDWLAAEMLLVTQRRPDLVQVKLADGARDNWTFLDGERMPDGVSLLDFYHAAEHLSEALAAAYGEGSARYRGRLSTLRRKLRDDPRGAAKIIRALRYLRDKHPRSKRIKKELKYFRRNRDRMNYAEAQARGLPIGSGVVEAACKTLVSQRLKCSGMRWGHAGGQAVLTFRALAQSGRFEQGWELLIDSYKADVEVPPPKLRLVA